MANFDPPVGLVLNPSTKLDDLATPDDNTDLDVSTSRHGLTPKAPNDTTKFLRGDATWATIAASVPSSLSTQYADAGNVGTGEDTLHTYTMPGGTLAANGDMVEIIAMFDTATNSNAKTIKLHFGGTTLVSNSTTLVNNQNIYIRALVIRSGAATQVGSAVMHSPLVTILEAHNTAPAETLSGNVVIKTTGEATSDNDIIAKMFTVRRWPAP